MATPYYTISPFSMSSLKINEVNMKLYLHQVGQGPNRNQVVMVPSSEPAGFGTIAVNNWTVTDGSSPGANIVARAKGMHVQADQAAAAWCTSLLIVFEDGRFKGSSLQSLGISTGTGEFAIIGGTGEFKMARGTIKYNVVEASSVENTRELNIQAFYTPETPPAAQGTVTIVNATSQAE